MMKPPIFPLYALAGAAGVAPAIVRSSATPIFIGAGEFQLGAPFDVRVDFEGGNPAGSAALGALVRGFIGDYPAKSDYWEVVNRNLCRRLRAVLPTGTRFAVTFSIAPDLVYPVKRVSRVGMNEAGVESEWFEFGFSAPFSNRLHSLEVAYQYRPDCPAATIPDYRYVQQELLMYGAVHDLGRAAGRHSAAAYLLARFPTLIGLSVSIDGESGTVFRERDRQSGVLPLPMDGDCRAQRRNPTEELVFAPAEYCAGSLLPGHFNRRYITPPLATGAGGPAYEAEIRSVAAGQAAGIVLPEEFAARAGRYGLVGAADMDISWRGAFLTNGPGRAHPPPVVCGVLPAWFPTYRPAELLGLALPDAPLAAVVPMCLANRLEQMKRGIRASPQVLGRRLILFRGPVAKL